MTALGVQATEVLQPGTTRALPVSVEAGHHGDASGATATSDTPSRADLQRMFKARCPGRVERLLGVALPTERPDFKSIADICTCAAASMEGMPEGTTLGEFRAQATQAALACSKNTITAHNELRTRKALGPYLQAQGLDAQQVAAFSHCAAATHWKNTVDAAQEGVGRPETGAWWDVCTEQIGRKGMPEPTN